MKLSIQKLTLLLSLVLYTDAVRTTVRKTTMIDDVASDCDQICEGQEDDGCNTECNDKFPLPSKVLQVALGKISFLSSEVEQARNNCLKDDSAGDVSTEAAAVYNPCVNRKCHCNRKGDSCSTYLDCPVEERVPIDEEDLTDIERENIMREDYGVRNLSDPKATKPDPLDSVSWFHKQECDQICKGEEEIDLCNTECNDKLPKNSNVLQVALGKISVLSSELKQEKNNCLKDDSAGDVSTEAEAPHNYCDHRGQCNCFRYGKRCSSHLDCPVEPEYDEEDLYDLEQEKIAWAEGENARAREENRKL